MLSPHFNPRSPCGERPNLAPFLSSSFVFQSTLPVRGATIIRCVVNLHRLRFQSTLPVRGATCRLYRDAQRFAISIHAPRAGSDTQLRRADRQKGHFNPRSPCGERHKRYRRLSDRTRDFNPRSPCGERPHINCPFQLQRIFQSTLPVRGATTVRREPPCRVQISIHAPRAGSDCKEARRDRDTHISIHAPRAGSDSQVAKSLQSREYFNPRSPCGERRALAQMSDVTDRFQSTLPVRGATQHRQVQQGRSFISIHAPRAGSDVKPFLSSPAIAYFNPRSPCGERLGGFRDKINDFVISIHAPRAGSDNFFTARSSAIVQFQSTLPVRGATMYHFLAAFAVLISIHAPRAGSDQMSIITSKWCWRFQSTLPVRGATALGAACHAPAGDFNPRSPCGERPPYIVSTTGSFKFQSTLPVRGATTGKPDPLPGNGYFNPRSPCGERLCPACMEAGGTSISIHAPRAGSDPHSFRA